MFMGAKMAPDLLPWDAVFSVFLHSFLVTWTRSLGAWERPQVNAPR